MECQQIHRTTHNSSDGWFSMRCFEYTLYILYRSLSLALSLTPSLHNAYSVNINYVQSYWVWRTALNCDIVVNDFKSLCIAWIQCIMAYVRVWLGVCLIVCSYVYVCVLLNHHTINRELLFCATEMTTLLVGEFINALCTCICSHFTKM